MDRVIWINLTHIIQFKYMQLSFLIWMFDYYLLKKVSCRAWDRCTDDFFGYQINV